MSAECCCAFALAAAMINVTSKTLLMDDDFIQITKRIQQIDQYVC